MHVIEVEEVRKYYGSFPAIKGISFSISKGKIFTIIGPNGAGKTTLLKLISGLLKPTRGSIRLLGKDPRRDKSVSRSIFYIPDNASRLREDLSLEDTIIAFSLLRGLPLRASLVEAYKIAEELELREFRNARIGRLSRGTKQKVFLLLALLSRADIILADEPTSMLDIKTREFLMNKLKELSSLGTTIFFSSHIIYEVEKIAEYIILIEDGKKIYEGPAEELIRKISSNEYELLVDDIERISKALEDVGIEYEYAGRFLIVKHKDAAFLRRTIPKLVAELDLELLRFAPKSPLSSAVMEYGKDSLRAIRVLL